MRPKDIIKYFFYKRVWSCFILAILFVTFFLSVTMSLSFFGIGVSFDTLKGCHEYSISNPMTIISFAGTFVAISLTVLGFALNNFSNRIKSSNSVKTTLDDAVDILLTRYRGKAKSLLFINVYLFPLLGRAFTIVLLLLCMIAHSVIGDFRIFYLLIYTVLIITIILSIFIEVFGIYSDTNFILFKSSEILMSKIDKRLKYLFKTRKRATNGKIFALRRFQRIDVHEGVKFLYSAFGNIYYPPLRSSEKSFIKNKKKYHTLIELTLCQIVSMDAMKGIKIDDDNKNDMLQKSFDSFFAKSVRYEKSFKEDLEAEINYLDKIDDNEYYFYQKDNIQSQLREIRDRIMKGKNNEFEK